MASSAPTREPVDAHAGGRVKKRPRLGVTRPTTALPFAASSLLAARRPPAAAAAAPHGRRARWACTMCTFANGGARKRCEMCGTERALRTAPFMVPEPDSLPEPDSHSLLVGSMADAAPTSPSEDAPAVAVQERRTSTDLDASPPPRAPRDDLGMLAPPAPAPRPSLTDDERPSPRSVRFADEDQETKPGDRVFALFERNRCWGGTVVKTTGNEENLRLDVVFDDGEEQSVFASDVLAAPPHQPESIGPNAKARMRVAEAARAGGWTAPHFNDDDAPPPKKRGRPPKAPDAAPPQKKKRGRPKKGDFAARDRVNGELSQGRVAPRATRHEAAGSDRGGSCRATPAGGL
jgi:hypothetical protein